MIPTGDHHTRELLIRRVSDFTAPGVELIENDNNPQPQQQEQQPIGNIYLVPGLEFEEHFDDEEALTDERNIADTAANVENSLTQHDVNDDPLIQPEQQGEEEEEEINQQQQQQQPPQLEVENVVAPNRRCNFKFPTRQMKLWIVCTCLVLFGVSNVIMTKVQAGPMYNYPNLLNLYSAFMYIPISFAYIIPVSKFGWFHNSIPSSGVPKRPFLIMGAFDSLAMAMQVYSSIYLPGQLLVLLPQAAIPISMIFSRWILHERYTISQYCGGAIVILGIVVVLLPVFFHIRAPEFTCQAIDPLQDCSICRVETTQQSCVSHVREVQQQYFSQDATTTTTTLPFLSEEGVACEWVSKTDSLGEDDMLVVIWSIIMVASCIPMTLSSIYKQVALSTDIDPMYVNGWVSVFQFLFAIPLSIPAGLYASKLHLTKIPSNLWDGILCLFAQHDSVIGTCHPDETCAKAFWNVHVTLITSIGYTLSVILMLKYGSTSLLYVALTVMVPLSHLVFSFLYHTSIHLTDWIGLLVLVGGLYCYRFGSFLDMNATQSTTMTTTIVENINDQTILTRSRTASWEQMLREPFLKRGDV